MCKDSFILCDFYLHNLKSTCISANICLEKYVSSRAMISKACGYWEQVQLPRYQYIESVDRTIHHSAEVVTEPVLSPDSDLTDMLIISCINSLLIEDQ